MKEKAYLAILLPLSLITLIGGIGAILNWRGVYVGLSGLGIFSIQMLTIVYHTKKNKMHADELKSKNNSK